jgi:uncharacterized protein YecE (DUF72 family)
VTPPPSILVGTSGWSYPSGRGTWNGVFYPSPRPKGFDELAYYAVRFDTVEVNSTFYRQPDPGLVRGWLHRTPRTFQFAVKLYQKFTHPDMYLARPGTRDWTVSVSDVDEFRTGLAPLAESGRLAALLLQFPSSFKAGAEAADYLDWLLGALAGYPLAVELRHRSWSDAGADTSARLAAHRASWVLIDEPKFETSIRQDLTAATMSPLLYVRLHGRRADQWWDHDRMEDRYNYLYSAEELKPYSAAALAARGSGRRVLMYLNNHFSAKAAANAAILRHQLGDLLPGDYPQAFVERYPELAGLVATAGLPL